MVNVRTENVKLHDVNVNCYIAGDEGPPVILLHGAGVDSANISWREIIAPLAKRYHVYAPDLPGYGDSDKPDVVYSLSFYVATLKQLMDHFQLEKTSLVGLSLGGGITLAYTLEYPEQVDKITLIASWGLFRKLPYHLLTYWYTASFFNELSYKWAGKNRRFVKWALLNSLFGEPDRVSEQLIDLIYDALNTPDAGKAFISFQRSEITRTSLNTPLVDKLAHITHPTFIVHGSDDPAVPVKYAKRAHETMPNSELFIMEGCKHWPQKEKPEVFTQALIEFLERT